MCPLVRCDKTRVLWPQRCCLCFEKEGRGTQPKEHRSHSEIWRWEYNAVGMFQCVCKWESCQRKRNHEKGKLQEDSERQGSLQLN